MADRPTPPPARAYVALTPGLTNRRIAARYGCTPHYVGRVLLGHEPPSRAFRAFMAEMLELPEAVLWGDDVTTAA